jgi:methyl-accepting chemotaxis protein
VRAGASHVSDAEAITYEISRVIDIMGKITAASQEESKGIGQITQTVAQMDEVAQKNAALVAQATGAASSLESQSNELKAPISMFRLDVSPEAGAREDATQTHTAVPARARVLEPPALNRLVPQSVRVPEIAAACEWDSLLVVARANRVRVLRCRHRRIAPTKKFPRWSSAH